jgi:hypothetical protein
MEVPAKWAGSEIDEATDSEAYYEWFDYTPEYAPREVISGGRFKVTSVEPDEVFGTIINIEQIGVFDPFNKTLVNREDL